ncbi:MAG: hydroxysqualene dehydroxylase HpnE [Rhodoferax sp.]|nr:hydroxysqualene dehydroxylase HpnE [Rhodoferax sp.]
MKVAIVGAGWAGVAAAVAATAAGHSVTVFEAARTAGGRARALPANLPDGTPVLLDNGQHILIGAYTETLRLMQQLGVSEPDAVLRLPLRLQFPNGDGLALPRWPSPFDALAGLLTTRGWTGRDKWSLVTTASGWQRAGFHCAPETTVAELCRTLPPRVMDRLIDPLCVAALNTPSARASGQVFLRVLQDSLLGGRGSSNLLLPIIDLTGLLPQVALQWLVQRGGIVRLGTRAQALRWVADPGSGVPSAPPWQVNGETFDAVVWATAASAAAAELSRHAFGAPDPVANPILRWTATTRELAFESIATVYAYAGGVRLPHPMLTLRSELDRPEPAENAALQGPAQFVFDRGQLGGPVGLLALVVSASTGDRANVQTRVLAQAQTQLARFLGGKTLAAVQTVIEKQATFACTPGLHRPSQTIAPALFACGDYVDGPYPATLEGAVRSGLAAAKLLSKVG